MIKVNKNAKQNIFSFILGAIIFGGISAYAATIISSSSVSYSNSTSKLTSTNVQGAIDELYAIGTSNNDFSHIKLIGSKYYNYPSSSVNISESFTDPDVSKAKGFIVSRFISNATSISDFVSDNISLSIRTNGGFLLANGLSFYSNRSTIGSISVSDNTVTFNGSVWNSQYYNYYYLFY